MITYVVFLEISLRTFRFLVWLDSTKISWFITKKLSKMRKIVKNGQKRSKKGCDPILLSYTYFWCPMWISESTFNLSYIINTLPAEPSMQDDSSPGGFLPSGSRTNLCLFHLSRKIPLTRHALYISKNNFFSFSYIIKRMWFIIKMFFNWNCAVIYYWWLYEPIATEKLKYLLLINNISRAEVFYHIF